MSPKYEQKAIFDLNSRFSGVNKKSILKATLAVLNATTIDPRILKALNFMIITDDYSPICWFFTLKRKSDAADIRNWVGFIMIKHNFHRPETHSYETWQRVVFIKY